MNSGILARLFSVSWLSPPDPEAMLCMSLVNYNSPSQAPHENMENCRIHLVIHFLPYVKWWLSILMKSLKIPQEQS